MSRNFKTAEVNSMQLMNERAFALFILPIMLSNVFQQLYAPVNAAVISRFRSADDLAVIGACSFTAMLQGFVFGGMSTGFGICLCDCAGETGAFSKGELSRSSKVWTASLVLTGFLTFLGFIAAAAAPLILTFLRLPKELRVMACPYLAMLLAGSGPSTLRGLMIWMLQAKKQTAKKKPAKKTPAKRRTASKKTASKTKPGKTEKRVFRAKKEKPAAAAQGE